jgi:hypothetical protein
MPLSLTTRSMAGLFNFDSGVLAWGDPALDVTPLVIKHVESPALGK